MTSRKTKQKPRGNTPNRGAGRIDDKTWDRVQRCAAKSGKTFTKWTVDLWLAECNRLGVK